MSRNLVEYPITVTEIRDALRKQADEIEKEERIGDLRPLLFRTAANIVMRAEFVTYDIGQGLP